MREQTRHTGEKLDHRCSSFSFFCFLFLKRSAPSELMTEDLVMGWREKSARYWSEERWVQTRDLAIVGSAWEHGGESRSDVDGCARVSPRSAGKIYRRSLNAWRSTEVAREGRA